MTKLYEETTEEETNSNGNADLRPLPLVVPAFDGSRPDRLVGVGLNLYDVMAVDKLRGRRKRREESEPDEFRDWAPERHRGPAPRRGARP